jgi:hypothetical protein
LAKNYILVFAPDSLVKNIPATDTIMPHAVGATPDSTLNKVLTSFPDSLLKSRKKAKVEESATLTGLSVPPDTIVDTVAGKIDTVPVKPATVEKYYPGIFEKNALSVSSMRIKPRHPESKGWMLILILLVLLLIGVLNLLFHKKLSQLYKSFINPRFANQVIREENTRLRRVSSFLSITFLMVSGLFGYYVIDYWGLELNETKPFYRFSLVVFAIFIFHLFKIVAYWLSGQIFNTRKETGEYLFDLVLFNQILGLLLIPLVIILTYVKGIPSTLVINFGFILFAGFFMARIIRTYVNLGSSIGISKLYLFLYLCTLEILPFVLVAKLIIAKF